MAKGDQLQPKALRDRKREDLVEELLKLRREQFNLRVQQAVGQLTRSDQVRKVRRNIARVKTVLGEQARREAKRV
jgi:large subunit ribosomal protein L29